MLVIRDEQIKALDESMLRSFKNRMVSHLRRTCPEETSGMSDEELRTLIQDGINKAESYQIFEDNDVRRFLEYMLILNPDFDQDSSFPEIQEILNDEEMDGTEKMDEIDFYYNSKLRAE
jgi:glucose-6-phosphate 1-dehydrogenase